MIKDLVLLVLGALIAKIQSRYRGELLYLCRNDRIFTPTAVGNQDIKILYKKRAINALSISKILVVNNTQHILRQEDVIGDGLCIKENKEGKFLRIDLQNHTDKQNVYSIPISKDRKKVTISFKYLNPGDAWLFQVFHTGVSSEDLICQCNAAGITATKKIKIYGKPFVELVVSFPIQLLLIFAMFGLGLECYRYGGFMILLAVLVWIGMACLVWLVFSSWELQYRFCGWYKLARKNGF